MICAVNYQDFCSRLPFANVISSYDHTYLSSLDIYPLDTLTRDQAILQIVKRIFDSPEIAAGEHRLDQWQAGWGKNYEDYKSTEDVNVLVPGYYNKYPYIRIGGDLFGTSTPSTENTSVQMLMHYIYERFLCNKSSIVELGCGTGHHLIQLAQINNAHSFYGLDWAKSSQDIIKLYTERHPSINMYGLPIDFFNPPEDVNYIPRDSAIYTFAALEQIGTKHSAILDFIISSGPSIVIHLEPVAELLDPSVLLHYLSSRYFTARNYLHGYLTELLRRQDMGELTIHLSSPTGVGSLFIEGYSLIVWSPNF